MLKLRAMPRVTLATPQVTKLLIIPCVCVLERALQHKPLTAYQTASIAAVVLGVGIV